ncbi:hypothetical protein [Methylobacterium sp. 77]|uniref:hypothetical protein n=1 Tax=Methylobacterium sp. 77 TaxID=1101192 RepID=UPI000373E401|nr:hypothetical protein [Methylobacterium sp. 77]
MVPDIAAAIMFIGMQEGWFTGCKLSDHFGPTKSVPVAARAIINGMDKASTIAGYFRDFQAALRATGHVPGGIAPFIPTPPITTAPVPPITNDNPPATDLTKPVVRDNPLPEPTVVARPSWGSRG